MTDADDTPATDIRRRTMLLGCAAVGIVGVVAMCAGGGVVGWWAWWEKGPATTVIDHPFWNKRPTADQIDSLWEQVSSKGAPAYIFIDSNFLTWGSDAPSPHNSTNRKFFIRPLELKSKKVMLEEMQRAMTETTDAEHYKSKYQH